jgi:hypothetical protein
MAMRRVVLLGRGVLVDPDHVDRIVRADRDLGTLGLVVGGADERRRDRRVGGDREAGEGEQQQRGGGAERRGNGVTSWRDLTAGPSLLRTAVPQPLAGPPRPKRERWPAG